MWGAVSGEAFHWAPVEQASGQLQACQASCLFGQFWEALISTFGWNLPSHALRLP